MARTRTRRELLQDSALAAIAAGGVYGALEGLSAQPARAAVAATRFPAEQHLMRGIRLVVDEGQRVVVPPLHHEVVTARLRVRGRRGLLEARAALDAALAGSSGAMRRRPRASGSRSRGGCPTSANTCRACGRQPLPRVPAPRSSGVACAGQARAGGAGRDSFPERPERAAARGQRPRDPAAERRCAHVSAGASAIVAALDGAIEVTSIRRGFVGRGFDGRRSLTKELAVPAGIAGADRIPTGRSSSSASRRRTRRASAPGGSRTSRRFRA